MHSFDDMNAGGLFDDEDDAAWGALLHGGQQAGKKEKGKKSKKKKKDADTGANETKGTTSLVSFKSNAKCHQGAVHAFTLKRKDGTEVQVFGGGTHRGGRLNELSFVPDMVVAPADLLGSFRQVPAHLRIAKYFPNPIMVGIPFPDMGVPKVPVAFWKDLVADVMESGIKTLYLHCAGGHGRTGTMLAIVYALAVDEPIESVDDLVDMLRKAYCEEIVESVAQFEYIAKITDLPYDGTCLPTKNFTKYTSGGTSSGHVGMVYYGGSFSAKGHWSERFDKWGHYEEAKRAWYWVSEELRKEAETFIKKGTNETTGLVARELAAHHQLQKYAGAQLNKTVGQKTTYYIDWSSANYLTAKSMDEVMAFVDALANDPAYAEIVRKKQKDGVILPGSASKYN
jgi:hypothetical protein